MTTRLIPAFTGLVGVLIGAVLFFAWGVNATRAPLAATDDDGAALFERHCAGCHEAPAISRQIRDQSDEEVLRFLGTHGAASDAEDRRILRYLRAITPGELACAGACGPRTPPPGR